MLVVPADKLGFALKVVCRLSTYAREEKILSVIRKIRVRLVVKKCLRNAINCPTLNLTAVR